MTQEPKIEQCCAEPRGFVGGVCDHCNGAVMPDDDELLSMTHMDLLIKAAYYKNKLNLMVRGVQYVLSKKELYVANDLADLLRSATRP